MSQMVAPTASSLQSLRDMAQQGVPLLGILVNLEMGGRYVPDAVVQAALGAAFGPQASGRARFSPEPVSLQKALRRAIDDIPGKRPDKITNPPGDKGKYDVTFIEYQGADKPTASVKLRCWTTLDDTGSGTGGSGGVRWHVQTDPLSSPLYLPLQSAITRHLTLQSGPDIAAALVEGLIKGQLQGMAWRKHGGIYFVPKDESLANFETLDLLIAAVEGVPALDPETGQPVLLPSGQVKRVGGLANGSTVEMCGSFDNDVFRVKAAEIMHRAMLDEVRDLAKEVGEIAASHQKGTKVQASTYQSRLAQAKQLGLKARVYRDLLRLNTRDIEAELEKLSQSVGGLLGVTAVSGGVPGAAPLQQSKSA